MSIEIMFLGAAGTVTGSKYLLSTDQAKILIDCGLFQGLKSLRLQNWEPLPFQASEIDAVILTHAHLDHSGFIPRLVKEGFRGKIFSTAATKEVAHIILMDAGHLMEEEAEFLNRHKKSKHSPALPLFTQKDAEKAMSLFETVNFDEDITIKPSVRFRFQYAGHILGASSVIISAENRKIAFSGDIGRLQDKIFFPPNPLPEVDYLIIESTYGNRRHVQVDSADELAEAINEVYAHKGVLMIPAFAVGRVQALMYDLSVLKRKKLIPNFPMYLNSPMGINVSDIFVKYKDLHRLSAEECREACQAVTYVRDVEESKVLNEKGGPMLLIAGSGMLTGGRILHHLKAYASDPKNMILLTGYQAPGTRGESLINKAQEVKIHGDYIPVRAKVRILNNMSAHADYSEIIEWLGQSSRLQPQKVFITHGEASAADELRRRISEKFNWPCNVPVQDQVEILR